MRLVRASGGWNGKPRSTADRARSSVEPMRDSAMQLGRRQLPRQLPQQLPQQPLRQRVHLQRIRAAKRASRSDFATRFDNDFAQIFLLGHISLEG
jgi:hypothetical protein